MKVMIAQINPTVGDLAGNLTIIQQSVLQGISAKCDVVVLPELATTGYPPRDLLYSINFWQEHKKLIAKLSSFIQKQSRQITVIVGGLHEVMLSGGRYARYNAAWVIDKHFGERVVHKRLLPCYDVFDETRYFSSAVDEPYSPIPIRIKSKDKSDCTVLCDVLICEDIWNNNHRGGEEWMKPATYSVDPVEDVARYGQGPLFVLNGSPFWIGKIEETAKLIRSICLRIDQPVVWCNQVGAHDDIITGGYSMAAIPTQSSPEHKDVAVRTAKMFQEDHMVVRFSDENTHHHNLNEDREITTSLYELPTLNGKRVDEGDFEMFSVYRALFLHMSDYKRRCQFQRAVLGLSGGIDSAVVAVIAAHVFGGSNVTGIGMPSPYSSEGSVNDAKELAKCLKIRFEVKQIDEVYNAVKDLFLTGAKDKFDNSLTDENIQPRARAMILMAHSNEYDPCLLLTTGNKSEITVGYCTIYGDMCGGLAVISDLWKTQVYKLAKFLNKYFDNPIPEGTISKPASAELRPNQKDTDSLPPYDVLDALLKLFVEEELTVEQVLATGWAEKFASWFSESQKFASAVANDMHRKYRIAEYKRMQMPPGAKLQKRSFGSGRRMPIAMKTSTI